MAERVTFRCPGAYFQDRLGRDLECGEFKRRGRSFLVTCDRATLEDMIDDADYTAYHTDADQSIRAAAKRALPALRAALADLREEASS